MKKDLMLLMGDSGRLYTAYPEQVRTGIQSRVIINNRIKHIILLDYDDTDMGYVRVKMMKLRKKFGLPNMYIFQTSRGNFSVMCFKLVDWEVYRTILLQSKCCKRFVDIALKRKETTLRITPKVEKKSNLILRYIIKSKSDFFTNDFIRSFVFRLIGYEEGVIHDKMDRQRS